MCDCLWVSDVVTLDEFLDVVTGYFEVAFFVFGLEQFYGVCGAVFEMRAEILWAVFVVSSVFVAAFSVSSCNS